MPAREKIEAQAKVIEVQARVTEISRGIFQVELENGLKSLVRLSGKMRMNNINVLVGDIVTVELSPYDLRKGRIIFRKKKDARK